MMIKTVLNACPENIGRFALFIYFLFSLNACAPVKGVVNKEIKVWHDVHDDKVIFNIKNMSGTSVVFQSLRNLYIEVNLQGSWKRLPYVPCKCGTPCSPPIPTRLKPKESTSVYWARISRKCLGQSSEELRQDSGQYRTLFNYQVLENNLIKKSERVWVEFDL